MSFGEFIANHPQWADIAIGILAAQGILNSVGNDYLRALGCMLTIRMSLFLLKKYYKEGLPKIFQD